MSQIKAGAVLSYAGVAFSTVAGLLYTPWVFQCSLADNYGLYSLVLSVVNFFLPPRPFVMNGYERGLVAGIASAARGGEVVAAGLLITVLFGCLRGALPVLRGKEVCDG